MTLVHPVARFRFLQALLESEGSHLGASRHKRQSRTGKGDGSLAKRLPSPKIVLDAHPLGQRQYNTERGGDADAEQSLAHRLRSGGVPPLPLDASERGSQRAPNASVGSKLMHASERI